MRTLIRLMVVVLVLAEAVGAEPYVDTIGGTTYDCSTICAGVQRMVYSRPGRAVHAGWWWSDTASPFPDRNSRYNLYDCRTGAWRWWEEDYMLSGTNPYPARSGYGGIDYDVSREQPVMAFHVASPLRSVVGRGTTAGPGNFQFCRGPEGYQWPWVAVTASGTIHVTAIDTATQDEVWYMKTTDFQTWSLPWHISDPDPMFPCHQITASKTSDRVAVLWVDAGGWPVNRLFLRTSENDGDSWSAVGEIPPPPAYGADTAATFHIASLGSVYDRDDRLGIVAAVAPVIRDTVWPTPAEIWYYNPALVPPWNEVHRADVPAQSVRHSLGYNTIFACRPKVGQNPETGELYAAWSEFDTANVEPVTSLLRADIWVASSNDEGRTWSTATRLTGPDTRSRLYVDLAPVVNDTLHLVWMEDLQAGMYVQGQGTLTENPVVYLQLPADDIGIAEAGPARPVRAAVSLTRGVLWMGPGAAGAGGRLLDAAGRNVARLRPGANDLRYLAPGVYFAAGAEPGCGAKVVLTR